MYKVLLFAGTAEGRKIAEYLEEQHIKSRVCVVSSYGGELLPQSKMISVSVKRLTKEEMKAEMEGVEPEGLVLDATHPYADLATKNIASAAKEAGRAYYRVLRESALEEALESDSVRESTDGKNIRECSMKKVDINPNIVFVRNTEEAAEKLKETTGNVLLTTGSKELSAFTCVPDYKERLYARVLSLPEVVEMCAELGFSGKHLICMQGPFSKELNAAMLRQINASWMVTKESGRGGGFPEKCQAAREAGCGLIVIGRPVQEEGMSLTETLELLDRKFQNTAWVDKNETSQGAVPDDVGKECQVDITEEKQGAGVTLVGIGMGTKETLTCEGAEAIAQADVLIGAKRMVEPFVRDGQQVFLSYKPDEICKHISSLSADKKAVVLLSGDVGFYSGATKLLQRLPGNTKVICGISSMIYFCSRLQTVWEDIYPVSIHGRERNLIGLLKERHRLFVLAGSRECVSEICKKLVYYGMEAVKVSVGERLSYPDEKITVKQAKDLTEYEADGLCVLLLERQESANYGLEQNEAADSIWLKENIVTHGKPDTLFLRDKVPMTKEEIRSISLSKLRLTRDAVVYDIGAGTGSVSVELAQQAVDGRVYAIEKKEEAAALIIKNKQRFAVDNLTVVSGLAPEALKELEAPGYAFVGGSSGNLKEILELLLAKNPQIRVVVNAITLETVSETVQCLKELPFTDTEIISVNVAKSRQAGNYHLMMGQNPVYVISATGNKK